MMKQIKKVLTRDITIGAAVLSLMLVLAALAGATYPPFANSSTWDVASYINTNFTAQYSPWVGFKAQCLNDNSWVGAQWLLINWHCGQPPTYKYNADMEFTTSLPYDWWIHTWGTDYVTYTPTGLNWEDSDWSYSSDCSCHCVDEWYNDGYACQHTGP